MFTKLNTLLEKNRKLNKDNQFDRFATYEFTDERNFNNVGDALGIELNDDINSFYGKLYASNQFFYLNESLISLLFAKDADDYIILQQNITGHILMKQQLKQEITWFIGIIEDNDMMITVNNADGSVWYENAGDVPHMRISNSISDFLELLTPALAPKAIVDKIEPTPSTLWGRIKATFGRV